MRFRYVLFIGLILLSTYLFIYSFYLEPFWLEVSHYQIKADVKVPIKIAHITDFHTLGIGRLEEKVFNSLESENPDLIVVTGDTKAEKGTYQNCRDVLSRLSARYGVWVIPGNWEYWTPPVEINNDEKIKEIHFLVNQNHRVRDDIWIIGLDDALAGHPNIDEAIKGLPSKIFKLVLLHSPAYFDYSFKIGDLFLAGHSHGGQVRLPLIGALWVPPGTGKYVQGWFEKSRSKMYVSRGLGTSIIPVRFLCRPELDYIELIPQ